MARALAIETSGRIGSVAAVLDGCVVAEERFEHGLAHAARIIPMIDRLCIAQNWKPAEIDHLYVSAGPGSFTGLRIGITLAKTLALSTGVKLVAVPSVRVLAENAPQDAINLIIVLDAKRDHIFTARFERASAAHEWIEREPAHLDTLTSILARSPRPVHLLGEGNPFHQKFIAASDSSAIVTPEDSWRARAAAVAKIGMQLASEGQFVDPFSLTPIYIRRPEAEEKFEQRAAANRA